MEVMYNFLMENAELIYDVVVGTLIAVCIISHILVATLRSGKGVKIFFAIFGGLLLLSSILLALIWKGTIVVSFSPVLTAIKKVEYSPYLAMALVISCASEFSGMLYLLRASCDKVELVSQNPMPSVEESSISVPSNVRKAGERKHGEYKIIEEDQI